AQPASTARFPTTAMPPVIIPVSVASVIYSFLSRPSLSRTEGWPVVSNFVARQPFGYGIDPVLPGHIVHGMPFVVIADITGIVEPRPFAQRTVHCILLAESKHEV